MASSRMKKSSSWRRRPDRISDLTDDVLGHVLSVLPTKEAARAAALSRRWRHVFGSVHAISLEEEEGERENDWDTYFVEAEMQKSRSDRLLDGLSAALLSRPRCPGVAVPLRSLRFSFDRWRNWDKVAVDQWLAYVLPRPRRNRGSNGSHRELHLDLRFKIGPICGPNLNNQRDGGSDSDDDRYRLLWTYPVPRRLFSCTAIRTLCLRNCRLELPGVPIDLPFLETLRLMDLGDSGRSIQSLISSCPRLTDLTLEALWHLKRLSLVDKRLRRLAIGCCHNLRSVTIEASTELRSLEYTGEAPTKYLLSLSLHGSPASCTIDLCRTPYDTVEFTGITSFLEKIFDTKHLHLHHHRLESRFFAAGFPLFSGMTRLTLQGCVRTRYTVVAMGRILEQTPSLEVLLLIMKDPHEESARRGHWYRSSEITVPDKLSFSIPCLRHRMREIGMEGYDGCEPQRMLAKLLLGNALVLERLHVKFAEGLSSRRKRELEVQMGRWGAANFRKQFHQIS